MCELKALDEPPVPAERLQPVRGDGAKKPHRVVPTRLPGPRVDGLEEVLGLGMPRPPQVGGELLERPQRLGQNGSHGESSDGTHRETVTAATPRVRVERSSTP